MVVQEDNMELEAAPQLCLVEEIEEIAKLSINSVVGLSTPKTMKVQGKIAQQEVVVLINCGAKHNFISTKLVQKLTLTVEGTSEYGVLMGTWAAVKGEGTLDGMQVNWRTLTMRFEWGVRR